MLSIIKWKELFTVLHQNLSLIPRSDRKESLCVRGIFILPLKSVSKALDKNWSWNSFLVYVQIIWPAKLKQGVVGRDICSSWSFSNFWHALAAPDVDLNSKGSYTESRLCKVLLSLTFPVYHQLSAATAVGRLQWPDNMCCVSLHLEIHKASLPFKGDDIYQKQV